MELASPAVSETSVYANGLMCTILEINFVMSIVLF